VSDFRWGFVKQYPLAGVAIVLGIRQGVKDWLRGTSVVWNFGFDDGMGVTYAMNLLDGNKRKIEYVDATWQPKTNGGVFEAGDLNLGRAIKPEHVPTKVQWEGPKNRKLPDALYGRSLLLVSDPLKDLIDGFEPSLHQFFPIDVFFKSSGELAKKMYFLNICTRLDSVDQELTTCELQSGRMWRPDLGGELVFNLEQIGNHHLWHDQHIFKGWMISDAQHDAMVEAKITGLVFHKDKDNHWEPPAWR
jgi:hypothetical protein